MKPSKYMNQTILSMEDATKAMADCKNHPKLVCLMLKQSAFNNRKIRLANEFALDQHKKLVVEIAFATKLQDEFCRGELL